MPGLKTLLIAKIALTSLLWCIPLLMFPASLFAALGMPAPEPMLFARLLGAAYLSLVLGYYLGLKGIDHGASARPTLNVAIASNGLACALLAYYGMTGAWSSWGVSARAFMWLSTIGALALTASFAWYRARLGNAD